MSKRFGKRIVRSAKTGANAGVNSGVKFVFFSAAFGAVILVANAIKNSFKG